MMSANIYQRKDNVIKNRNGKKGRLKNLNLRQVMVELSIRTEKMGRRVKKNRIMSALFVVVKHLQISYFIFQPDVSEICLLTFNEVCDGVV